MAIETVDEIAEDAGGLFGKALADNLAFLPGNLLWGAIVGAAATVSGLSPAAATLFSAIVFSGTAQLAVVKILALPLATIFLTSLLLSLRFLPMSVALNHRLRMPLWRRLLLSVALVDSSFVLMAKRGPGGLGRYLAGLGVSNYLSWITGTAAGALLGPALPRSWAGVVEALTIVIFVVLTVELCSTRRVAAAAVLGAGIGLAATLVIPTGAAIAAGAVISSGFLALGDRATPG